MKNISFFNEKDSYLLTDLTFMKRPLTDAGILELQEKFLTNGLHHITVPTVQDGRKLIFTFLNSLSFILQTIACATVSDALLPNNVVDIYEELSNDKNLNSLNSDYMQNFFFEQFHCDFIWVEMTSSLAASQWYLDFENNFLDLNMEKNTPMLVVTYENDLNVKSNLL